MRELPQTIQAKGLEADFVIILDKICWVKFLEDELIIGFEQEWLGFVKEEKEKKVSMWGSNKLSNEAFEKLKSEIRNSLLVKGDIR